MFRRSRKVLLQKLKASQEHITKLGQDNIRLRNCLQGSLILATDKNGFIAKPYPEVLDTVETHNERICTTLAARKGD